MVKKVGVEMNSLDKMEDYDRLKQERDELKDKLLVAESNLLNERYACAELSDKLNDAIAQVEVMVDATTALIAAGKMLLRKAPPETVMEAERQLDVIREGVSKCEEALSITPSAALKEIQARTIDEIRDYFKKSATSDKNYITALIVVALDELAAAKRKGE